MENSGLGIDDLLDNSTELFAITGLHRSDLHGEEDSDDSADEIEAYLQELEIHDYEDMDYEPENIDDEPVVHSPVLSSTPVRRSSTEQDEPPTTPTGNIATERGTPSIPPSTWSENFTPLNIGPFIPTTHGLVHEITASTTALDVFKQIFDFSLFDKIAEETNLYAAQKQQNNPDPTWTPTNSEDIKAFIGIHIIMGLANYPRYHLYWSQDDYFTNYGIKNTMPRRRFQALERYLHINNITKIPKKGEPDFDPLYHVRLIINSCRIQFQKAYTPGRELSIDEGMIAYCGRIAYLQYIPKKPTKFGIKVWMIAESKTGYVPNYIIYTGTLSEENMDPDLDGHNQGYKVVMAVAKPYLNLGHHVYFDNLFTLVDLLEDLHKTNTYATGTVRANRKGYPAEIKKKALKVGQFIERQKGNVVMTKWHDKCEVSLVTTITDGNTNPLTVHRKSKDPSKKEK